MKTFRQILLENTSEQEAFDFIECLTLSGGPSSAKCKINNNIRKFLKDKTVTKDLVLYRGISLIKKRIDLKNIDELNNLKPGDNAPKFLMKIYGNFASYTKKKSVAKYYSKGNVEIILKAKVKKENIIADLEQLSGGIWSDEEEYYKNDKEVIVEEPIEAKIEFIKGKL